MGDIEKLGDGGDVGVVRADEDESVCCRDVGWGGRGRTLVSGAKTRKKERGVIEGKRMATFRKILKISCALSSSLTRGRLR